MTDCWDLVGTGALLVSGVLLFIFATPVENFLQTAFTPKDSISAAPTVEVMQDDDLAAAAAEAADGRPVYIERKFQQAAG